MHCCVLNMLEKGDGPVRQTMQTHIAAVQLAQYESMDQSLRGALGHEASDMRDLLELEIW